MAEVIFHSEWINLCDSNCQYTACGASRTLAALCSERLCVEMRMNTRGKRHFYCIALYPTSYTIQILQDMHHYITDTNLAFGCFFLLIWNVPLKWAATHEQTEKGRDKVKQTACGSKGCASRLIFSCIFIAHSILFVRFSSLRASFLPCWPLILLRQKVPSMIWITNACHGHVNGKNWKDYSNYIFFFQRGGHNNKN